MEKLKTDVESLIRYLCKDEVRFYCDNISYNEVISILKRVLKKINDYDLKKDVESLIRYLCQDEVRFYCDNISYNEVIDILKRVIKKLN